MSISKVFKSVIPSMNYTFKDGTTVAFIGGKVVLDAGHYSDEMMEEVVNVGQHKSKHPHIYVDENEQEIDSEALSPIEELRKQIREEEAAKLKAAMNLAPSTSEAGNFASSVSNSTNNIQVGDSNSGAVATPVPAGASTVAAMVAASKSK